MVAESAHPTPGGARVKVDTIFEWICMDKHMQKSFDFASSLPKSLSPLLPYYNSGYGTTGFYQVVCNLVDWPKLSPATGTTEWSATD